MCLPGAAAIFHTGLLAPYRDTFDPSGRYFAFVVDQFRSIDAPYLLPKPDLQEIAGIHYVGSITMMLVVAVSFVALGPLAFLRMRSLLRAGFIAKTDGGLMSSGSPAGPPLPISIRNCLGISALAVAFFADFTLIGIVPEALLTIALVAPFWRLTWLFFLCSDAALMIVAVVMWWQLLSVKSSGPRR
jgi:hypothetical protein